MYEPEANFFQRHLEDKAADVYDRLTFVDPGSAYNNEPPEPWISVRVATTGRCRRCESCRTTPFSRLSFSLSL